MTKHEALQIANRAQLVGRWRIETTTAIKISYSKSSVEVGKGIQNFTRVVYMFTSGMRHQLLVLNKFARLISLLKNVSMIHYYLRQWHLHAFTTLTCIYSDHTVSLLCHYVWSLDELKELSKMFQLCLASESYLLKTRKTHDPTSMNGKHNNRHRGATKLNPNISKQ